MSRIEVDQRKEEKPILGYVCSFERFQTIDGGRIDVLEEILKNRGIVATRGMGVLLTPINDYRHFNHWPGRVTIVLDRDMPVLVTQEGVVWTTEVPCRYFEEIKLPGNHFESGIDEIKKMVEKYVPDRFFRLTVKNESAR